MGDLLYVVDGAGFWILDVFDPSEPVPVGWLLRVRGRRIQTIANQTLPAGSHDLEWDGRDLDGQLAPAGIYFYVIQMDGHRTAGRLSLVR